MIISRWFTAHNNAHIFSLNLSEAKRRFDNLKRRFSKKKAKYKKAKRSGSGSRETKQVETELKNYGSLRRVASYWRLKENTVSNLPKTNVAEINPNDDGMSEAEDKVSIFSKKTLFSSVLTNQPIIWNSVAKTLQSEKT